MKHTAPILAALALLVPAAQAANGDPQKRLTKADTARARTVAIRAADLGAGWKADRSSNKDQANPRCSTYNPDQSNLVETGRYESPDFTRSDGTFVASTAGVFRTARMAKQGFSRVAAPALPGCFAELFKKGARPTVVTIVSTGSLAFPKYGDRTVAYRLKAAVKTPSANVPVTVDIVLVNRGRIDVAMIFLGISKPLPASFERALVARVDARAEQAQL